MNLTLLKRPALLLGVAVLALAPTGFASSVTILNPSFENQALSNGSFTFGAQSWDTTGGNSITFNSVAATDTEYDSFSSLPDGVQAAELGAGGGGANQFLSQTLSATVMANTLYTLTVYVGNPLPNAGIYSGYTASLSANGVTLASDPGTGVSPTAGAFALDTLTYNSGACPAELGQALVITLGNHDDAGAVAFDLVQLTATPSTSTAPEPAAWVFLTGGLGFLAIVRQRVIR